MATKLVVSFAKKFYLKKFIMAFPFFLFGILIVDPLLADYAFRSAFIFAFAAFITLLYDLPLWLILVYLIEVFKKGTPERLAIAFIVINLYYLAISFIGGFFLFSYPFTAYDPIPFLGYTLPAFAIRFFVVWFVFRICFERIPSGDVTSGSSIMRRRGLKRVVRGLFLFIAVISLYAFFISVNVSVDSLERFYIDNGEDIFIRSGSGFFKQADLERISSLQGTVKAVPRLAFQIRLEGVSDYFGKLVVGIEPTQELVLDLFDFYKGGIDLQENCCIVSSSFANEYGLDLGDFVRIRSYQANYALIPYFEYISHGYQLKVVGIFRFRSRHIQYELLSYEIRDASIIVHIETAQMILGVNGFNRIAIKMNSNLWLHNYYTALRTKAEELKAIPNFSNLYTGSKNALLEHYNYWASGLLQRHLPIIRVYYSSFAISLIALLCLRSRWPVNLILSASGIALGTPLGILAEPVLSKIFFNRPAPLIIDETRLEILTAIGLSILILAIYRIKFALSDIIVRKTG